MMKNISARDKKFLLAGGISLVAYLLFTFVIEPIYLKQKYINRQIQNKIQFIEKYYEILNQKRYYTDKNAANQRVYKNLERRFLNETQTGLATASLQKFIEGFARQSGVEIERIRVEKPKTLEGMTAVSVRITVQSTLRNLSQLIYKIENFPKFLIVEGLSIQRINKNDPEAIKTSLLVSGFIKTLEAIEAKKI